MTPSLVESRTFGAVASRRNVSLFFSLFPTKPQIYALLSVFFLFPINVGIGTALLIVSSSKRTRRSLTSSNGVDGQKGRVGLEQYREAETDVKIDRFSGPVDSFGRGCPHLSGRGATAMRVNCFYLIPSVTKKYRDILFRSNISQLLADFQSPPRPPPPHQSPLEKVYAHLTSKDEGYHMSPEG